MRTAVVTGASGGIGSVISERLASEGIAVVVGYHRARDRADALASRLSGHGHRVAQIAVDEPASLEALVADLAAPVDVLVNCAGVTEPVAHDDLDGLSDELIDRIFATNWRGPFACVRALRPLLEQAKDPVVVNVSSVAAVTGQGSNVAYCASKAALDSMTRSLGRALAPHIRMVSVSPGWVLGEYAERMSAEMLAVQTEATPLKRLATPADVAEAVIAAVDHLPFTTGTVISVDGGRPLGVS
ncbi:MAG: SDR family oxidoreductase [Actinomycetota bacterium]